MPRLPRSTPKPRDHRRLPGDRCWRFALLLFLLPTPALAQQKWNDRPFRDALDAWNVPGLAVAIVHDDRVVYLQGFGIKELGKPAPVTPDTVFPLASCTKPFTSLLVAMLADEGRLDWDDKVRQHLPDFRLAEPHANALVTLRDLVTHRTGVGGHDPLWYHAPWPLAERVRKLAHVQPDHDFRTEFEYQTILFGAAGLAAGQAAGRPWEECVRRRLFEPLAMKTASSVAPDPATVDLASPHRADADGVLHRMPRYPLKEPDPAGSIHASARDLGPFLRFLLGDGRWQGRRLLSKERLREPFEPRMIIPMGEFARAMNPDTKILAYGMGWIVQDYRGHEILMHGGAIDGFRTHLTLVPEARLGIALLNNRNGTFMNLALSNTIVDRVLGLSAKDWNAYYLKQQAEEDRGRWAEIRAIQARKTGRPPVRPLTAYEGAYRDPAYGTCKVEAHEGKLVWSWGSFRVPLDAAGRDEFVADRAPAVALPVSFRVDATGRANAVRFFDRVFDRVEAPPGR